MTKKNYEIEIVIWASAQLRTVGDAFYWADHKLPRIKTFTTQKAAREWLERNNFVPRFSGKRPAVYKSQPDRYGYSGMQATIREQGNSGWLPSCDEETVRRRIMKCLY